MYTTESRLSKADFDDFIRSVLSPQALKDLARALKFVQRSRKLVPSVFVAALLRASADKEWTLSSIHRDYNVMMVRLGRAPISWEPFHDFLARPQFKDFIVSLSAKIRAMSLRLCVGRTADLVGSLREKLGIRDVMVQDGCVVPIENNSLRSVFKGTTGSAAKIHMTLSLGRLAPVNSTVTSGTSSEKAEIPLELLDGMLILCDAGYEDQKLFHAIEEHGGFYIIKVSCDCMYRVLWQCEMERDGAVSRAVQPTDSACDPIGVSAHCNRDRRNRDIIAMTSNGLKVRIVRIYNPVTKNYVNFATNISPGKMDIFQIAETYRSRWQCERYFRCYKGFSALSGSRSGFRHIQEAMIELAQMAADLKHILAVVLETETSHVISHEKMAHSGNVYVQYLIESMLMGLTSARHFYRVLIAAAKDLRGSATSYINRIRGKSLRSIADIISRERFVSTIGYQWDKTESQWVEPMTKPT